jgi:tRNA 2-thiocytidine biosynthesis protein TtcA
MGETKHPIVNKKLKQSAAFSYHLAKKVGKTVKKYGMIESGDRILVGVSGGKDSLTLLRLLNDRMGLFPNDYELLALHVASNFRCEGLIDPGSLEEYFRENGYSYRIIPLNLYAGKRGMSSYWCARNRRRVLFDTANRLGFNKIALGHHRNDVIETALLNMFYHAEISTMLPRQELFGGKMTIIRPLYTIPEADTIRFSRMHEFPSVTCHCPFDRETKREFFKRLLLEVERQHPKACLNALRALENVNEEYLPSSKIVEDVVL